MRRQVIVAFAAVVVMVLITALRPVPVPAQAPAGSTLMETRPWPTESPRELLSTPGAAFTASLVLPGSGQAALGARRWAAFAAVEVAAWAVRLSALGDRREATVAYRDLAWDAARIPGDHERRDGSWGYYETLTQYAASGAYDADPARAGVQPEPDATTYNGSVWALARSIYLPGGAGEPGTDEYEKALEFYDDRAAGPGFLWSWEGNDEAWNRFRSFIRDADDASRTAGIALGAVLANHVVSAVDAFIIARLQSEPGIRLGSRMAPAPLRWSLELHIPIQDLQWTFQQSQ